MKVTTCKNLNDVKSKGIGKVDPSEIIETDISLDEYDLKMLIGALQKMEQPMKIKTDNKKALYNALELNKQLEQRIVELEEENDDYECNYNNIYSGFNKFDTSSLYKTFRKMA